MTLKGQEIKISEDEFYRAAEVGIHRCREAYRQGCKDKFVRGDEYDVHLRGALAEFAVAKFLKVEWTASVNTFKNEPDVVYRGKSIEVKCSDSTENILRNGLKLPKTIELHKDDIYALVYCDPKQQDIVVTLVGWISAMKALAYPKVLNGYRFIPYEDLTEFKPVK
jgi:hypothetical protein